LRHDVTGRDDLPVITLNCHDNQCVSRTPAPTKLPPARLDPDAEAKPGAD